MPLFYRRGGEEKRGKRGERERRRERGGEREEERGKGEEGKEERGRGGKRERIMIQLLVHLQNKHKLFQEMSLLKD